jgi:O-succinylbenzoic acid--CoA ligase
METEYQFRSIILNEKEISLEDIKTDIVIPQTDFEKSTLNFIRDWVNGVVTYNINTSGSSGTPKNISITRYQMAESARMTLQALNLKSGDTALVCLNPQFIAGKMMLVRSLLGDLRIIATEPSSNPLKKITRPFDFIALVPMQIQTILTSADKHKLDYSKAVLVGGAALSAEQLSLIKAIKSPVFGTYGMTETISHIALQNLNAHSEEENFKILPGIKIIIDDRGCLVINAPFLEGEIHTNDMVKMHDSKSFTWLGRWDNVVNTGGIKVFPEKVEKDLQSMMSTLNFHQSFLIGSVKDALLGEKIILITEGNVDEKWKEILKLHKQSFPTYETPRDVYSVNKFVYTENNKIDRKATIRATLAQDFIQ